MAKLSAPHWKSAKTAIGEASFPSGESGAENFFENRRKEEFNLQSFGELHIEPCVTYGENSAKVFKGNHSPVN